MQVEVIYTQGRLTFAQPLRLKQDNVRLILIVPDEEIAFADNPHEPLVHQADPTQSALSYAARVDRILSPYSHLLVQPPATHGNACKALWKEHLLGKSLRTHETPNL
jgi:hypothetical protein